MPTSRRLNNSSAKTCGLYVNAQNGTDYVAYNDGSGSATCVDLGNNRVKFQLDDGRVACRDGDWLRWAHESEGYAYEMVLTGGDSHSDGASYAQIGGYWVLLQNNDGFDNFVNVKTGQYLLIR